jgi:anti-anti-sigma factor
MSLLRPDGAPFAVSARGDEEGRLTVAARGELDVATRDQFNACVDDAIARRFDCLVLDLSGLTFVDSVGLKCILDVWNRSRSEDFQMTVVPGGRQVQRAFALSGMDSLMPVDQGNATAEPPEDEHLAYLHCPACRVVVEDHAGLLAGVEQCPECGTALEPSPPSMFRSPVRHPGLPGEQPA